MDSSSSVKLLSVTDKPDNCNNNNCNHVIEKNTLLELKSYELLSDELPPEKNDTMFKKRSSSLLCYIGWILIGCAIIFLITTAVLVAVYIGKLGFYIPSCCTVRSSHIQTIFSQFRTIFFNSWRCFFNETVA